MSVIHKYVVRLNGQAPILHLPAGAKVLSAGMQGDEVVAWVLQEDEREGLGRIPVRIFYVGTGWAGQDLSGCEFVGTVQDRTWTWHVFARYGE